LGGKIGDFWEWGKGRRNNPKNRAIVSTSTFLDINSKTEEKENYRLEFPPKNYFKQVCG
jgi:hypothetical protein